MQINAYSKANYFPTEFDSLETDTIQTESMDFPPEESIAEIDYPSESYTYTPASEMQAVEDYTYANLLLQAQQNATQENGETSSIETNEATVEESEVQKVTIIGTREEGDDIQRVTIPGKRPEPEIDPWQGLTVGDLFGNLLPPDVQPEPVVEPPEVRNEHVCPNRPAVQPANVDLKALRDKIQTLGEQIKAIPAAQNRKEYSFLIYADANGNLRASSMAMGSNEEVRINNSDQRQGEKIVAWLHSHPKDRSSDNEGKVSTPETSPNGVGDTGMADSLLRTTSSGTLDPNALMYLLDMDSGNIYEYPLQGPLEGRPIGNNITENPCPNHS